MVVYQMDEVLIMKTYNKVAREIGVIKKYECLKDLLSFIVYIASDRFNCISGRIFIMDSRL